MDHGGANWRERAIRDAVLAGDASAWRAWFAEHFDRLAAYVRWRCGGLADLADDVTQDAWLTAVRRLRSFDPDRGPFFALALRHRGQRHAQCPPVSTPVREARPAARPDR